MCRERDVCVYIYIYIYVHTYIYIYIVICLDLLVVEPALAGPPALRLREGRLSCRVN